MSTGLQPTPAEKLAILGGPVGFLGEAVTTDQGGWMTPRVYPCGVVLHILRDAKNRFESNLPSASTRGRAFGLPPVVKTHDPPPVVNGSSLWTSQAIRCVVMGRSGGENSVCGRLVPLGTVHAGMTIVTVDLAHQSGLGRQSNRLHYV